MDKVARKSHVDLRGYSDALLGKPFGFDGLLFDTTDAELRTAYTIGYARGFRRLHGYGWPDAELDDVEEYVLGGAGGGRTYFAPTDLVFGGFTEATL